MTLRNAICLATLVVCVSAVSLASTTLHEVTYKGTVISTADQTVSVKVVDEETEAESSMTFKLDINTKVLRGDTLVPLAQAGITKDEKIAVTIDHDVDETLAIVVRLDEKG